jgi:hypothetical protein
MLVREVGPTTEQGHINSEMTQELLQSNDVLVPGR